MNILYCLVEWRGEQIISPPGDNFTPVDHNLPLGAKLRMGLWVIFQARATFENVAFSKRT
jgi:hypothetical protein